MVLLAITVGLAIAALAFVRTLGNESTAKLLLRDSSVYKAMIPEQLLATQRTNPLFAGIPLDSPDIQNAIKDSFDSTSVNRSGDAVVTGYYDWLEGKTSQPQFNTQVKPDADRLAENIGQIVFAKAQALPACKLADLQQGGISADPFKARCLPPGVTAETARKFITTEIKNNAPVIQATSLQSDAIRLPDGRTIQQAYPDAPAWYQRAWLLPFVLLGTAFLLSGLLFWLGGLRRGSRYISSGLVLGGLLGLIASVLIEPVLKSNAKAITDGLSSASLQASAGQLLHQTGSLIQAGMLSLSVVVIGAGLLIWLVFRIATGHAHK